MKRRFNRLLSLVLCAVLLLPAAASPALAVETGSSFGDGLTWTLDASGCLTISGDGEIPDYTDPTHSPWYSVRNDVTEIVIDDGITRIGDFSLVSLDNVTSVDLPQSLLSIGTQSMAYLWSLTTLHIPSGVTTLGPACFGGCAELSSLYIYNPNTTFEFLPYGYRYDPSVDNYVAIPNVTLYGYANSTAETYANAHSNIEFISLGGGTISGTSVKTEVMERTDSRDLIHIYTEEDLKKIAENPEGHYLLEDDLTLSDWTPVDLSGSFDGQGHTISGLSVTLSVSGRYGLFGIMSGTVANLNVSGEINVAENAWTAAGLLAGECTGTIVACSAEGTVTVVGGDTAYAGGLTGKGGTMENCSAEVTVALTTTQASSWAYAGGLSGSYVTKAGNCTYTGDILLTQPVSAPGLKAEVRGIASNNVDACTNCTVSGSLTMNVMDCYNSGAIALEGAAASHNYATVTVTSQGDIYAHGCADSTNCTNHADISATGTGEEGVVDAAGLMRVEGGHNFGTITAVALGTEKAVAQGISAATGSGLSNTGSVSSTANNGQAVAIGIEGSASDCQNTAAITAVGFDAAASGLDGCDYSKNTANIRATGVSTDADSHSFAVGVSSAEETINSGNISASGAILNQAFGCRGCTNSSNSGTITVRTSEDGYAYGLYYCEDSYNSGGVSAIGSGCSGDSVVFAFGHTGGNCTSSAHVNASSDGCTSDPENGTYYGHVRGGNSASARVARPNYPVITQSGAKETPYWDRHGDFIVVTEGTAAMDWTAAEPPKPEAAPAADILFGGFYYAQQEDAFIPVMTNALGSFSFNNGRGAVLSDPDSTDYSEVYLLLALGNLCPENSTADTLTVELPDGFSFAPDSVVTQSTVEIASMGYMDVENVWLTVYPLYSTGYSEGAVLTCRYALGTEGTFQALSTGCKINLTTERADYAKINYGYDENTKAYRFAYYHWDPSALEEDNTRFHQELNQLAALLSMIIYFTNTNDLDALAAMEGLGFSCIDLSGANSITDCRHIVAQKMIVTADNQVQQLVVTSILGTSSLEGWIGNLTFLEGGSNHLTFLSSAQSARSSLNQFLENYGVDSVEQKMLLTGHSRGAAAANLLADMVNQQYASNWENIYAYTYATPHTALPEVVEAAAHRNTNIFNIINFYDVVGYVPGCYDLHGTTMFYKVTDDPVAPLYIPYLQTLSLERTLTSSEARGALTVGVYRALLQMERVLFYHLMTYYIEDIWLSTADTYMTYSAAVTSMEEQYNEILASFAGDGIGILFSSLRDYVQDHVINPMIFHGIMEAEKFTFQELATDDTGFDAAYPADFSSFMQNPANDTYLQVNCPVDLDIYDDNGTLIGQVKDDQVVSGSDKLILTVVGDKKSLNLLSDQTYIVEITGYDTGTMDLSMLTNDETGTTTNIQQYHDLPVSKNSTLTAKVENGVMTLLDASQQQVEPEVIEGSDLGTATISISGHDSVAFSLGEGTYNVGEQVILTAAPAQEGTVFLGWYNEDVLVSADATTCIVCTETMTLTPKFGSSGEVPPGEDNDDPAGGDDDVPSGDEDDDPIRGTADATGFYHAWGEKIIDPEGNETLIKGMSFGNCIFGNPSDYREGPMQDHDAYSYYEIAELGLDHVRFEMNYGLFESDEDPAVTVDSNGNFQVDTSKYKEEGFEWIDMNLEWAKAAAVNLLLQIELPQGGYQASTSVMAPGESWEIANGGKNLWIDMQEDGTANYETEDYKLNQQRLIELWKEIARRYADEPCIVGYGLLNEPVVPQVKTNGVPDKDATADQLRDLYQRIVDAIRTVDENHIIFTQCLISWFDPDDYNATDWNLMDLSETQVLLDDDNIVYQFHFFEPFAYTHQGADWMPQYQNMVTSYPSDNISISNWSSLGLQSSSPTGDTEGDWVYYESPWITSGTVYGTAYNCAQPQLAAVNTGSNSVWYDDITITRKDKAGNTTVLYSYEFTDGFGNFASHWFQSGGSFTWDNEVGHDGAGSICISGTSGQWDNAYSWDNFYLDPEYTYQISGWVKGGNGSQYPQLSYMYADQVLPLNRDYVEHMLKTYAQFGQEHHVPLFSGSWGFYYTCYERGGEEYFKDVTELYEEYGISSNYHSYHDSTFGLYLSESWQPVEYRNETLYQMIAKYYGKVETPDTAFVGTSFENGTITTYIQGVQPGRILAAVYNEAGQFQKLIEVDVEIPEAMDHTNGFRPVIKLNCESVELEEGDYFKLFMVDTHYQPLCPESDPIS